MREKICSLRQYIPQPYSKTTHNDGTDLLSRSMSTHDIRGKARREALAETEMWFFPYERHLNGEK